METPLELITQRQEAKLSRAHKGRETIKIKKEVHSETQTKTHELDSGIGGKQTWRQTGETERKHQNTDNR